MGTTRGEAGVTADQLGPQDLKRLTDAHARLRAAVAACGPFRGKQLEPNDDVDVQDAAEMQRAYREVEAAEDDLWRLRQELLNWTRPPTAPRASFIADWFSDEDRVYDDLEAQKS